jgi:uncharacterized damage-inducible protein DinB
MNKLIKHFDFEHFSNSKILHALQSLSKNSDRALTMFSHLLSSHSMWLSRVNKTEITCTLFQERTLAECEILMNENLQGWKFFLSNMSEQDLQTNIEFMSAWEDKPSKRIMSIEDAITHLINHSSYHRGQIIQLIKGTVEDLPLSTYIMFASQIIE